MRTEHGQQPDGHVLVPKVLQPYLGGAETLGPLRAQGQQQIPQTLIADDGARG